MYEDTMYPRLAITGCTDVENTEKTSSTSCNHKGPSCQIRREVRAASTVWSNAGIAPPAIMEGLLRSERLWQLDHTRNWEKPPFQANCFLFVKMVGARSVMWWTQQQQQQ